MHGRGTKLLVIGIAVLIAVAVYTTISNRVRYNDYDTVPYTVKAGDTLWDIASTRCFANGVRDNYDVRRVVMVIQKINGIDSYIYPGQRLEIPYYCE